MRTRLVIVQPYVPRYRAAFYQSLIGHLGEQGIDVDLVVGRMHSVRGDAEPTLDTHLRTDRLEPVTGGRARWRSLRGLAGSGDLLLLEQAVKNLDCYLPLVRKHLGGPSVGLWGHGRTYSAVQGDLTAGFKRWVTRRADWFFAYTAAGAEYVVSHGFPAARVSVVNNTFDANALVEAVRAVSDSEVRQLAAQHHFDPEHAALFLGAVDPAKGTTYLEEMAKAAVALDPRFVLLIAGAGPDESRLRRVQRDGAPIRMLGRVDGQEKALALRCARVLTIPSQVGLVAIDALASGCPLITRADRLHAPELEYMTDRTALILAHDTSPAVFAAATVSLMNDASRLATMSDDCLAEAAAHPLDSMVNPFVEGVLAWADVVRHGL